MYSKVLRIRNGHRLIMEIHNIGNRLTIVYKIDNCKYGNEKTIRLIWNYLSGDNIRNIEELKDYTYKLSALKRDLEERFRFKLFNYQFDNLTNTEYLLLNGIELIHLEEEKMSVRNFRVENGIKKVTVINKGKIEHFQYNKTDISDCGDGLKDFISKWSFRIDPSELEQYISRGLKNNIRSKQARRYD